MAVRGARMILWIALQFLAVLSCSLHSVSFLHLFILQFTIALPYVFFFTLLTVKCRALLFSRCVNMSPQRALDSLTLCPFFSMNHCSPSTLDLFCPRKPLYLSGSLYNTALCLDHLSASAFTLQLPNTASTALWCCCAIWRERWGQ